MGVRDTRGTLFFEVEKILKIKRPYSFLLENVKQLVTIDNGDTFWHENKSGNIGVHDYSCALRASASHNYLLVNGKRRLTPREN
jgi:hypothetical protein